MTDFSPFMLRHAPLRALYRQAHRLAGRDRLLAARPVCGLCGAREGFWAGLAHTLYREATCAACAASLRNADTARMITRVLLGGEVPLARVGDRLASFDILEGQASGPIHQRLRASARYTCFEYWADVPPGQRRDGVMSNDFERLSFPDASFDLVISQDVFEHLANPDRAFAEIARVLRVGGCHVFTVPLHEGRSTRSRAGLRAVSHPDPLRAGAHVFTDWGDDLPALADRHGLATTRHAMHRFHAPAAITDVDATYEAYMQGDPLAYYRYNSVVFVSRKQAN